MSQAVQEFEPVTGSIIRVDQELIIERWFRITVLMPILGAHLPPEFEGEKGNIALQIICAISDIILEYNQELTLLRRVDIDEIFKPSGGSRRAKRFREDLIGRMMIFGLSFPAGILFGKDKILSKIQESLCIFVSFEPVYFFGGSKLTATGKHNNKLILIR